MANFRTWDVVRVPFPYTDRPVKQHRPALILAAESPEESHGLLWVLMITSAENRRWKNDVEIADLDASGLPVRSVVRCAKVATIQSSDAQRIGALSGADRARVRKSVAALLESAMHPRNERGWTREELYTRKKSD